jgi:RNA polymerase primary sigma factor
MVSVTMVNGKNSGSKSSSKTRDSRRDRSALELYLKDVSRRDLISREKERELVWRIKLGDEKALEEMVEANLRFVIKIAKEYQGNGLSLEDLIGEGNGGLVDAATRYDGRSGVKFTSYAVWWIRQRILLALGNKVRLVDLPMNKLKHLIMIGNVRSSLEQENGREVTYEEIGERADLDPHYVENLIGFYGWPVSLDAPADEDPDTTFIDTIRYEEEINAEEGFVQVGLVEDVRSALNILTPREGEVLSLYFGIDRENTATLEQIGDYLGLTKERVRQIRDSALETLEYSPKNRKLRSYLNENIDPKVDGPKAYWEKDLADNEKDD